MVELQQEDYVGLFGDTEFKIRYLETLEDSDYAENTKKANLSLFKQIGFMESVYNKDFYDFTLDETKTALVNLRRKNLIHLASDGAILRKYALFATYEKMSMSPTHPIALLGRSDFRSLLVKLDAEELYITYSMYKKTLSHLKNWTDKALLVLIWNGLVDKGYETLTLLNKENFTNDFTTVIIKQEEGECEEQTTTVIDLQDFEGYIIKNAFKEKYYTVLKSSVKFTNKPYDEEKEYELMTQSRYLFRNFVNKKIGTGDPVSSQTITNRFKLIKDALNKGQWKINNIYISGLVYYMLSIKSEWTKNEVRTFIKDNTELQLSFENVYPAYEKIKELYNDGK